MYIIKNKSIDSYYSDIGFTINVNLARVFHDRKQCNEVIEKYHDELEIISLIPLNEQEKKILCVELDEKIMKVSKFIENGLVTNYAIELEEISMKLRDTNGDTCF